MNKIITIIAALIITGLCAGLYFYGKSQGIEVLEPQGYISAHQRDLFYIALGLGMVALIPVLVMTFIIVQRYHAGNNKATKRFNHHWEIKPEASWIWAAFVSTIIITLAVILVKSTISVDPYKPLDHHREAKVIRVVALPWKWLFIYPEEDIATVNELVIPVDQPITFELTADAPMSSFWIPKLGGMIYTMEGMVTKLNLMATSPGQYEGKNAEINGKGYSGMKFMTRALPYPEYRQWVSQVQQAPEVLNTTTYQQLAQPTINHPTQVFGRADQALYGQIISKFMDPSHHSPHSSADHHAH